MPQHTLNMCTTLEEIELLVGKLTHANWRDLRTDREQDVQEKLGKMWDTTCELQKAIANPSIVAGYKADAISQVYRLGELINEMAFEPDHRQLLSIGMATELVVEKVKAYKRILSFSAKVQMLTGPEKAIEVDA